MTELLGKANVGQVTNVGRILVRQPYKIRQWSLPGQRTKACSKPTTQIPLRCSSPANSETQLDHRRKGYPKREKPEWALRKHLQCMQDSPKKVLEERAAHGGTNANPFRKDHGHLVNLQEGNCCKEQHQAGGREGGLKIKVNQDRQNLNLLKIIAAGRLRG